MPKNSQKLSFQDSQDSILHIFRLLTFIPPSALTKYLFDFLQLKKWTPCVTGTFHSPSFQEVGQNCFPLPSSPLSCPVSHKQPLTPGPYEVTTIITKMEMPHAPVNLRAILHSPSNTEWFLCLLVTHSQALLNTWFQ